MKLTVNDEPHIHKGNGCINALLEEFGANKEHTALMVNGKVIAYADWETPSLNENDEIEMLVFVGGG